MTEPIVALDLFAGAGGWDLAAHRLGIIPHGVENMPEAIATREAAGFSTIFNDVWDGLRDETLVPDYQLGIASPPCQTFSVAGNGSGRRALDEVLKLIEDDAYKLPGDGLRLAATEAGMDDRTALVLAPLAYFWRDRPTFIALEQVPAVLPVWHAYAEVLEGVGYSVAVANLHAEQYGVPQTRKRAILVARNDGKEARLPEPTHSKYHSRSPKRLDEGVLPWVSMAEALGMGLQSRPSPTITGGGTETGGAEPIAKMKRYTESEDWSLRSNYGTNGDPQNRGERTSDQPAPTITSKADRMKKLQGNQKPTGQEYQRRDEDQPAMTITTQASFYKWREEGEQSQALTEEEAATLQTFPPYPEAEGFYIHPANYGRRGIWPADEPAPTIRGVNRPMPDTYEKHERDACDPADAHQRLSEEEAATLQTFPPYPEPDKPHRFAETMEMVPEGGDWRDLPDEVAQEVMGAAYSNTAGGRTSYFRRLHRDKPSPTIVGSPDQKSTLLWHPTENRPISEEEAATMQTFPPHPGWGLTARPAVAVGNAVGRGLIGGQGAKDGVVKAMEAGDFIDSPHGDGSSYAERTRITVPEAGVLQTFQHGFPFQGGKGKRFLQIGNAIPVLLAQAVLSTLTE